MAFSLRGYFLLSPFLQSDGILTDQKHAQADPYGQPSFDTLPVRSEVAWIDFLAAFIQLVAEEKRKRASGRIVAGDRLQKLGEVE
jgi:hypothetical protein